MVREHSVGLDLLCLSLVEFLRRIVRGWSRNVSVFLLSSSTPSPRHGAFMRRASFVPHTTFLKHPLHIIHTYTRVCTG